MKMEDLQENNLKYNVIMIVQSTPVLKYRETEGRKDIGANFWNQGRTQEIRDRVVHLSED